MLEGTSLPELCCKSHLLLSSVVYAGGELAKRSEMNAPGRGFLGRRLLKWKKQRKNQSKRHHQRGQLQAGNVTDGRRHTAPRCVSLHWPDPTIDHAYVQGQDSHRGDAAI
jgi:hypothetical protein